MSTFKDLTVWKETKKLTRDIYAITHKLPSYELYALASQLRRAVISIGSNIAEGAGRGTLKDYVHFLYNAKGSAFEVEAQLLLCVELGYVTSDEIQEVLHQEAKVSYLLSRLISALEAQSTKKNSAYQETGCPYGMLDDEVLERKTEVEELNER
jgi:four helix bundle protein